MTPDDWSPWMRRTLPLLLGSLFFCYRPLWFERAVCKLTNGERLAALDALLDGSGVCDGPAGEPRSCVRPPNFPIGACQRAEDPDEPLRAWFCKDEEDELSRDPEPP